MLKSVGLRSMSLRRVRSSFLHLGRYAQRMQTSTFSTRLVANEDINKGTFKMTLAKNLACLVEESSSSLLASKKDINKGACKMTLAKNLACLVEESSSTLLEGNEDINKGTLKMTLAKNLACLVEESSHVYERKPKSRMELKRSLELRIKKRVKEQYINGKFQNLMQKVVAIPETLQDAYNCIKLNSNVNLTYSIDNISFGDMAEELSSEKFDINGNIQSISTKGPNKEVLILPNLRLKIVQEAIRIVLEVVYKPHFSKISHGCRSGRGHATALKYIGKEISNPDWWFTLVLNKKVDTCLLEKLISIMEDKIEDTSLYALLRNMFNAQVLNLEFGGFQKGHGLPQEGVLSPILMNIYLDRFDCEFYRLSLRYEALNVSSNSSEERSHSNLRNWFRRQLKQQDQPNNIGSNNPASRVHSCRFMDEIFFAFSGSKEDADCFKLEVVNFLQSHLYLDVDNETQILPCDGPHGIQFLGTLIKRSVKESPAVKAVHKLKEKVRLFALQKEEAWNVGTVRIGKKWLGHGLKKVKESEIKHLSDSSSTLSKISCFRKAGMKTDHWYKALLKVWMFDVVSKKEKSEEFILSKYVAEPALPQELRDSFYKFKECAEAYISSETAATLALLPNSVSNISVTFTEIIAPTDAIQKRLFRYGLTTYDGYGRTTSMLILQDTTQIIDWFSGLVRRWLRWYVDCDNFSEIKLIISNQVRKSCIRTLAAKYRIHESEIEKRFDSELSRIPSTQEIEQEMAYEMDSQPSNNDEALMYGISYSGLCILSLERIVINSRPCDCFVMGCLAPAPSVYTLHVMERQRFPGWKTGFSSCIHPSLNKRRIGLCKKHLSDLYLGHISLQSIDFGAWR